MQKVKRKTDDVDAGTIKKKKVNIVKGDQKNTGDEKQKTLVEKGKKFSDKGKNNFKKEGKFVKNFGDKGKKGFKKGGKDVKNGKPGPGKPFGKDQQSDEKPKWSEMKKEKKELRLTRRKAKATVEVFEISHKAKLLAAQIQR